jgi:excisionase family DNA binding protein
VLARKGYPELAITEFTKALGLMSRYPAPYAHRGDVWLEKGLWKRAASDYAAALNLNPSYAAALNGMARLLTLCPDPDVRDPEKAVVFARKAVAVFPRAAHLRTLARAYEAMGNRKAATDARERAAKQEQEAEYTFTLREVSDLLGCSRRLLGRMIRSGGLKAARVGNDYRISRADLEAFWRARGGGRLLSEDVR